MHTIYDNDLERAHLMPHIKDLYMSDKYVTQGEESVSYGEKHVRAGECALV